MAKRKVKDADGGQQTIVEQARKRYNRAKDFYDSPRTLAIADTQFVMGDSDNGYQWPQEVFRDRATINRKPCLTINVTAQHCNQIINNIRQNRPSARVLPVDDFADKDTANILGGMLRSIQSVSNADTAHDLAAEHAIYGGEGYWRVTTEYEDYNSFDQVIRIKSITNPFLVYIDPSSKEPDRSDARWAFVFEDISKDQAKEEHPELDPESWAEDTQYGWVQKDTIRRAEYFWCEYVKDTLYLLSDGTSVLKSELEKEGAQVEDSLITVEGQPVPGLEIIHKRETKRTQWKWCKLVGGEEEPVDERDWPGSYMPIITVVGKELNVNGEIIRKGVVRDLKDTARMVNYSYSAAVETVALQTKTPWLAAGEATEGYEDVWGAANVENRGMLPWNAWTEDGKQVPEPQRIQPAAMATAQVQMLQVSTEQMRAASGQQNANFGIKSEAQSGIGIQRLKVQGETATFHFPDNLVRGLKYEAVVVLDLIPKVYESQRVIRILGLDGKEEAAMLNPEMQQAYAEVEGKVEKIFNPGVGKYDVAIDTGPSFQTQRQEAAMHLTELAKAYPPLMQIAGDQVMRALDIPNGMGDAIADRMERAVPPELKDDKEKGQIPPEAQAMLAQQQEQMGQMQEALAQFEQEKGQYQQKILSAEAAKQKAEIEAKTAKAQLTIYTTVDSASKELQGQRQEVDEKGKEVEGKEQSGEYLAQAITPIAEAVVQNGETLTQGLAILAQMLQDGQQRSEQILLQLGEHMTREKPPAKFISKRGPDGSLTITQG